MEIVNTSAAEHDLADVLTWYDGYAPGVGLHFLAELESLAERIASNPMQFPVVRGEARRAESGVFPIICTSAYGEPGSRSSPASTVGETRPS